MAASIKVYLLLFLFSLVRHSSANLSIQLTNFIISHQQYFILWHLEQHVPSITAFLAFIILQHGILNHILPTSHPWFQ